MKVLAPGKLILSGEHSVVYGKPALAMAVNRYAIATASPENLPHVSFDLSNLSFQNRYTLATLQKIKKRIIQKYHRFINGDYKIKDVLQKPVELAQVAFTLFFETLNLKLHQGIKIHIHSDIPMGCGMGSSAATVLSIVHAIAHHLSVDISSETFYQLALQAENMQHGFSSGLDLRVSLNGGCLFVKDGEVFTRSVPTVPLFLVNTGTPLATTGECVSHVAPFFKTSTIGHDFADTTEAMDAALQTTDISLVIDAVKQNHRLLNLIEVVPEKVCEFVKSIEKNSGAAKICGAGSIVGDHAGIVLVVTEDESHLAELCAQYHYEILPIAGESRGVHIV